MKDKQQKSRTSHPSHKEPEGGKLKERNLDGVNPLVEQFEPMEASPYRQHFRMAGGD